MVYLNVDTELGLIALGGVPYKAEGPEEHGSFNLELWAKGITPIEKDGVEVNGVTVYKMESEDGFKMVEVGHAKASPGGGGDCEFCDTIRFTPNTLEAFRVWNASPDVTVIKDGEVLARNVEAYDSRPLHRPMVQAGIGVGAVILTGFAGRWLDWW